MTPTRPISDSRQASMHYEYEPSGNCAKCMTRWPCRYERERLADIREDEADRKADTVYGEPDAE